MVENKKSNTATNTRRLIMINLNQIQRKVLEKLKHNNSLISVELGKP